MRVGRSEVVGVLDGVMYSTPSEVLVRLDGADPDPVAIGAGADGQLELVLGGYLIRSGSSVVLVDAGLGHNRNPRMQGGHLLESLGALDLRAEDVTDVVFTHLHFDHVGWATQQGVPTFVNARHHVHAADWAHFVTAPDAAPGAVRKLAPIEPLLDSFDGDRVLSPTVTIRHAPGHTPGSVIVQVDDGGERALLVGDLAHKPCEFLESGWGCPFDVDPARTRATREEIVAEVTDTGTAVAAAHFPGLLPGRIDTGPRGRTWTTLRDP